MTRDAGFTLAETLVGLAVGAIAVTAAGMGVTAALNARAANLEASRMVEDLSAGVSLQRRLIAQAVPLRQPAGDDGVERYRFEGDATNMRFIAALWGDPGAAGLWEVSLALTPQGGRAALVLSGREFSEPKRGDPQPAEETAEAVLAEAETNAGATFAYAARSEEGAPQWTSAWAPEDGWPALVSFDPDGEGPAPAAVVALPVVIERAQPLSPEQLAEAAATIRERAAAIGRRSGPAGRTPPPIDQPTVIRPQVFAP